MVPILLESDRERRDSAGKELQNYYIDIVMSVLELILLVNNAIMHTSCLEGFASKDQVSDPFSHQKRIHVYRHSVFLDYVGDFSHEGI